MEQQYVIEGIQTGMQTFCLNLVMSSLSEKYLSA